MATTFGLTGAAGFVAPRHLEAMRDVGGELIAALDPHDAVGVLDRFFPNAAFFVDQNRFERFCERQRLAEGQPPFEWLSICSPNYLHDSQVRLALRLGASALCEKPLTVAPWNLDPLQELESRSPGCVRVVLQLRHHPAIKMLREQLSGSADIHDVHLTYVTRRGPWYDVSWKGNAEQSGGLAMNIGIHFFDLLLYLFGEVEHAEVHLREHRRLAGGFALERARVRWFLSVEESDLPQHTRDAGHHAYRTLTVGGAPQDLSGHFQQLHRKVYDDVLGGGGVDISTARPSIELVHRLRTLELGGSLERHPWLVP